MNGDFLDDIIYTDPGHSSQIMVSYQLPNNSTSQYSVTPQQAFYTTTFENALLVKNPDEGCISKTIETKRLTIPHSTALVDFDGDCMADLFVTVQDLTTGKKYYEIYLRRQYSESVQISAE